MGAARRLVRNCNLRAITGVQAAAWQALRGDQDEFKWFTMRTPDFAHVRSLPQSNSVEPYLGADWALMNGNVDARHLRFRRGGA